MKFKFPSGVSKTILNSRLWLLKNCFTCNTQVSVQGRSDQPENFSGGDGKSAGGVSPDAERLDLTVAKSSAKFAR